MTNYNFKVNRTKTDRTYFTSQSSDAWDLSPETELTYNELEQDFFADDDTDDDMKCIFFSNS